MELLDVSLKITRTARLDAAHLYLSADEVAQLCALILRDPTVGRKGEGDIYLLDWGEVTAKYMLHIASDDRIVVYLMRILPRPRGRKRLQVVGKAVREIALSAIRRKLERLLD